MSPNDNHGLWIQPCIQEYQKSTKKEPAGGRTGDIRQKRVQTGLMLRVYTL